MEHYHGLDQTQKVKYGMIASTVLYCIIQVTMEYRLDNGACIPLRAHTIVISVQHSENISNDEMRKDLKEFVIKVRIFNHILYQS